ncbi:MAG: hypothetical protein P8Y23_02550 [Candidatus Lokiarchaeota archaeon]
MNDEFLNNKIKELETQLENKKQEVFQCQDKIDSLEDMIMELEATINDKDENNSSYLLFQLNEMEKNYRELKNKQGILHLENLRLKQNLEKAKNNPVLLSVAEEKNKIKESNTSIPIKSEESRDHIIQQEDFKYINITCPECSSQKFLKVPLKIINQSQNVTTISVPSGVVCPHHFQIYVDKFFSIRGYQVSDFEFPKVEYYEGYLNNEIQYNDSKAHLASSPKFQKIINILRRCVDDREILGSAIFTNEGRVLYTSIPQKTLLDTIREFEIRNEKNVHSVLKMFLELRNNQKVCSEILEIQEREFILVLVFSENVNFGIGNMLLKDVVKQLKALS